MMVLAATETAAAAKLSFQGRNSGTTKQGAQEPALGPSNLCFVGRLSASGSQLRLAGGTSSWSWRLALFAHSGRRKVRAVGGRRGFVEILSAIRLEFGPADRLAC